MTLPKASSTAWEVKFSEGIRLMKCFWRFFSCGVLVPIPIACRELMDNLLQDVVDCRVSFLEGGRKQLEHH